MPEKNIFHFLSDNLRVEILTPFYFKFLNTYLNILFASIIA